jgi:hypothetical protein
MTRKISPVKWMHLFTNVDSWILGLLFELFPQLVGLPDRQVVYYPMANYLWNWIFWHPPFGMLSIMCATRTRVRALVTSLIKSWFHLHWHTNLNLAYPVLKCFLICPSLHRMTAPLSTATDGILLSLLLIEEATIRHEPMDTPRFFAPTIFIVHWGNHNAACLSGVTCGDCLWLSVTIGDDWCKHWCAVVGYPTNTAGKWQHIWRDSSVDHACILYPIHSPVHWTTAPFCLAISTSCSHTGNAKEATGWCK